MAVASKFGKAYKRMGGNRASADRKLGRATASLNAALAKRSALEDGRFAKTVKDIKGAKKAAWAAVTMARIVKLSDKNFSSSKRARGKLKALLDQNKVIA